MYSACRFVTALLILCAGTLASASKPALRVCVDSNNLPFSNSREEGFENALAHIVAHDLHRTLQFVWLRPRHRPTRTDNCDLAMETLAPDLMQPTRPYYRSTYAFVTRRDRNIHIASLADPTLRQYRIGFHVLGEEDAEIPPAELLVRRGLRRNLVGYHMFAHPLADNPPSELITAVEKQEVDMAIAWGPMAGYFAKESPVPLEVTPLCVPQRAYELPVTFAMSMGVRRGDDLLLEKLNAIIARRLPEIQRLLESYGVPLLGDSAQANCN